MTTKTSKNRPRIATIKGAVKIGSTVEIELSGKQMKFLISDPLVTDPAKGIISYQSPLGKSLLNKCAGDAFQYSVEERIFKGQILKLLDNC